MNLGRSQHMLARCFNERSQKMTGMTDPIGECGTIKLNAFASKNL